MFHVKQFADESCRVEIKHGERLFRLRSITAVGKWVLFCGCFGHAQ